MLTDVRQRLTQQDPWPARPLYGSGLGQPVPALAGWGHALGPGMGQAEHRVCHRRCHRKAAGCMAGQRTTVDPAGHRVPRRHRHCERPATGPGQTEQTAGNDPALANGLPVVERNQSPQRHRSDNHESRSQQHRDQHIKGTGWGFTNAATTKTRILLRSAVSTAA